MLEGWGVRPYNWSVSAGVQRQIGQRRVGRRRLLPSLVRQLHGRRQPARDAGTTTIQFCITAPTNDPRLPVAGQQICGFYDIKPAKNGQVQNLVRLAKHYGNQTEVYNGIDASVNWRIKGLTLFGGISTGRTATSQCFVVDAPVVYLSVTAPAVPTATSPQAPMATAKSCRRSSRSTRATACTSCRGAMNVSGTFQAVPQPASGGAFTSITADYVATNAEIRPSLGRDLAAGANGTATVDLLKPFALRGGHTKQFDMRLGKRSSASGKRRVRLSMDVYNVFNSNDWQTITTRLSSNAATNRWQRPTLILQARYFQIGTQIDF